MKDAFNKRNYMTVPNLMSLLRIVLIFPIAAAYRQGNLAAAAALVVVSGATDVADGWYARKFSCVTDVGKVLDPIADKLTLGVLIFSLSVRYPEMILLMTVFAMREFVMAGLGIQLIRRFGTVRSSLWYGKAATAVLYGAVLALLLLPNLSSGGVRVLIGAGAAAIVLGWLGYLRVYAGLLRSGSANT